MARVSAVILSLLSVLVIRFEASAQVGCYTTDFLTCYGGSLTCYNNFSDNSYFYGPTAAYLCDDIGYWYNISTLCASDLAACDSAYDTYVVEYDKCVAAYNATTASYNAALLTIAKQKKTIKKLKKLLQG